MWWLPCVPYSIMSITLCTLYRINHFNPMTCADQICYFWTNENATLGTIKTRNISAFASFCALLQCHLVANIKLLPYDSYHMIWTCLGINDIICMVLKDSTVGAQNNSFCHFYNKRTETMWHSDYHVICYTLISSIIDFSLDKHAFYSIHHISFKGYLG